MRELPVALFGLGTVGSEVARLLYRHRALYERRTGFRLPLKWIVVNRPHLPRDNPYPGATITTDPHQAFHDPDVRIGVEVMGPVAPSFAAASALLRAGKDVVTANKALLATRGRELFRLAKTHDRVIAFEGGVAGGVPIIAAVAESLASNQVTRISAILNGTSNYILTQMQERGLDYAAALAEAQRKGFAEADPKLDVDGTDACQKLALLSRLAFGAWVDWTRIPRRGIADLDAADVAYARELGYVVKLLATGQIEGADLVLRVTPTLAAKTHPLAAVRGEYNAVQIVGDAVGDAYFSGRGAGGSATASSVVADVLAVASGRAARTFAGTRLWEDDAPVAVFNPDARPASRFYLRFSIVDRPGVIAQIAGVLGTRGISIASVIQHEVPESRPPEAGVPLIVMTHAASETAVRAAVSETDSLAVVRQPTVCMPVAEEQRY